ncbi:MAG: hypothetical protein ABR886_07930 [Dehalococcoidales bacterium]|jgi:hypothetical protein
MAEADGKSSPGTAKILRIIARVIGIVVMMFFLALLIGDGVQSIHNEGFHGISAESLYVLVPSIIALAAFIVTWWREFTGGVLMVTAYLILSLAPSVHSVGYDDHPRFYTSLFFFALPFLVCGVLFIIASRLGKKAAN